MSREHFPEKWAPVFRRKCDQVWNLSGFCRRSVICGLIAAAALIFAGSAILSQEQYPSANVEIVVPFAAGGAVDVTGRVVAQALSKALARTFVVINRPGANSNIGNLAVVRSKPDGYTLLVSSIGLAANAALYKNLPYDPLQDLSPISLLSNAPLGLFVNKDVPANNLREFVAYVQANPNKLDYASYGMGSSPHLAAELFQRVTGTKMIHIPFSGNAPATVATVSGTTQVIFCSTVAALPFVQNGSLKPIAFGDDRRSVQLPDLPTFKEQGVDFTMGTWFGLLAPRNTPQSVIDTLSKAVSASLGDPELRKVIGNQGARVVGSSPDEFAEFLRAESARLAAVIRDANIRAD
jgi:tripartite-type tricarboxylate transporter receptor subunit TctC